MESFAVGSTTCDFLDQADFDQLCREWLKTDSFHHVVTLNPEMVVMAEDNKDFATALNEAEIRVPDGSGLVWAHWYIRSQFWSLFSSLVAFSFRHVERVTGVDAVISLAALCAKEGKSLYLLGGTKAQVTTTATLLLKKFPTLNVSCSPDHTADMKGPANILEDIRAHAPAVLLVAYGAPTQTVWIERNRQHLSSVRIAVGVGGAFAILSEDTPRAPYILRRFNVEWLWRLLLEPSRIGRIWRATVEFPRLMKKQKITPHG